MKVRCYRTKWHLIFQDFFDVGQFLIEKYRLVNIIIHIVLEYNEKFNVSFNRPIAGYANLCPNMISTQPQEFIGMLSTVKHEIIHALVKFAVNCSFLHALIFCLLCSLTQNFFHFCNLSTIVNFYYIPRELNKVTKILGNVLMLSRYLENR